MQIKIFYLLILFLGHKVYGQADTLNKFNVNNKKTGYWKVFLDLNAMPTDSSNSFFWGYEFYIDGELNINSFSKHSLAKRKFIFEGVLSTKGNPIPIDGILKEFLITEKDEQILLLKNSYKNGFPQIYIEYFFGENDIWHVIDFTKKYNNLEGSFFFTDYYSYYFTTKKRKKTTYWWYRKVNKKWKIVKAEEEIQK